MEGWFFIKVLCGLAILTVVIAAIFSVLVNSPLDGHELQIPRPVIKKKRKTDLDLRKRIFRTRYEFQIETPKGPAWVRVHPIMFSEKQVGDAVWVHIRDSGKKRSIKITD